MLVEVYTSDDQRLTYTITEVRRHVPKSNGFDDPLSRETETLWLQTSEGPKGTPTVLQVIADAVQRPARPTTPPPTRSRSRSSAPSAAPRRRPAGPQIQSIRRRTTAATDRGERR